MFDGELPVDWTYQVLKNSLKIAGWIGNDMHLEAKMDVKKDDLLSKSGLDILSISTGRVRMN